MLLKEEGESQQISLVLHFASSQVLASFYIFNLEMKGNAYHLFIIW